VIRSAIDGPPADKRRARSHSDCAGIVSVCVIKIAEAGTVYKSTSAAEPRVVDVDDVDVAAAATPPGMEGFTPSEWEPSDATSPAESKAHAPAAATQESDKCRAVNGVRIIGSRAPTPSATDIRPAAIVEWREAPRFVVNPSPSPRAYPVPISVAVRGPVRRNIRGIPNRTVVRLLAPGSVVVQIVVARNISRNVLCGSGIVLA